MGLRPVLRRLLSPKDDGSAAAAVAVLTYSFWTSAFNRDPSVIGKTIRLDNPFGSRSVAVVGVLEPSVPYPAETELMANMASSQHHLSATMVTGREHRMTEVFARHPPEGRRGSAVSQRSERWGDLLRARGRSPLARASGSDRTITSESAECVFRSLLPFFHSHSSVVI
jgi:putative ABC transport system permease protein